MSVSDISEKNYLFSQRGAADADRLTQQHDYFMKVLNRDTALPPAIDPASISMVFDVAAGSLAWTLDLARTPEIKARLSASAPNPVQLYACDLDPTQFPPSDVTGPLGITTFVHDMTEPFPPELIGKFDLVNTRLLTMALSKEGWEKALRNIHSLLKPGGRVLLFEFNLTWYHVDRDPPSDWGYEANERLDPTSWIDRYNAFIHRSFTVRKGFIPDLVYRLPSLLTSASLTVESNAPLAMPMGALCSTRPGPFGQSLAAHADFFIENLREALGYASRKALQHGSLEGLNGPITTEEGRQDAMNDWVDGMRATGALLAVNEIIARRD